MRKGIFNEASNQLRVPPAFWGFSITQLGRFSSDPNPPNPNKSWGVHTMTLPPRGPGMGGHTVVRIFPFSWNIDHYVSQN